MFLFDETGNVLLSLSVIAIHEITHMIFILFFGGRINEFSMSLCEMNIKTEKEFLASFQKLLISISAPIANIFLAVIFWGSFREFAQINAIIGVFQLLPIMSSDGDNVLEYLHVSIAVRKGMSFLVCFVVMTIGFALLIESKYNFSLLFISLYLIFTTCKYRD